MKFKELFDREIITEEQVRKSLRIYYEINCSLVKLETENNNQQPAQQVQPDNSQQPIQQSEPQPEQQPAQQPEPQPVQPQNDLQQAIDQQTKLAMASVRTKALTEEGKNPEVSETTENKIVRRFEGEVELSSGQKDNIQTFDDVIEVLASTKKDGIEILDELTAEIITLCSIQKVDELRTKIDNKKSKIFVEIYYGYNKNDSIGVRFNKRESSDILTSSILLDNEIINTKFTIDKVNKRIAEFRNYEAKRQ